MVFESLKLQGSTLTFTPEKEQTQKVIVCPRQTLTRGTYLFEETRRCFFQ